MISKHSVAILRVGLALVFLANALTAWLAPDEFAELVGGSFLANLLPMVAGTTFVTFILINDSLLFLILFFNLKFIIKYALLWASLYIVLVMLVIGEPIDALEHLGFLAMAITLYLELRYQA